MFQDLEEHVSMTSFLTFFKNSISNLQKQCAMMNPAMTTIMLLDLVVVLVNTAKHGG